MKPWTPDQCLALETPGKLLVSASAGSGKTSVMMERVARFLAAGGDVARIIVLTFTDAAAAEMKEKLLANLYDRIMIGENRAHLIANVRKIGTARISTIDKFCLQLYRTYFERLGLDPDVTLVEDEADGVLFRQAAQQVLADAAEQVESLDFLQRYTHNQSLDALTDHMQQLWRFSSVKPDAHAFLNDAVELSRGILEEDLSNRRKLAARLKERARELAPALQANFPAGLPLLQAMLDVFDDVLNASDYAAYLAAFSRVSLPRKPAKRGDDYVRALIEELGALKEGVSELFDDDLAAAAENWQQHEQAAGRDAAMLASLTERALTLYEAKKREERVVNFSDLEHAALSLMQREDVRNEVLSGVDALFVDEYQDTNGLQEALLNLLTGGELFLVGDVKQSIYGFRFAQPRLFLQRRNLFGQGKEGENVDLNCNFRSEPKILSFVNDVMDQVMTPDFGGIDYAHEARLQPGLPDSGLARVEIFLYRPARREPQPPPAVYSVRDGYREEAPDPAEGEYIATKIATLVREGRIRKGGKTVGVSYGDVAVLTRDHRIGDLTAALDKYGIPYYTEGDQKEVADEVREVMNLLSVLDNAQQDVPLAATMLTFWDFSEGDLMQLAGKEGFAAGALYGTPPPALAPRVEAFRARLAAYRQKARYCGVDEILTEVLRDTDYFAKVAARGAKALGALNAFLYRIQTHKCRRDLTAFLLEADRLPGYAPTAVEENAVRFYTIHKSKGLEFPVVFVAHAHNGYLRRRLSSAPVIADASYGIAVRYRSDYTECDTPRYLAMLAKREREEKEELVRLMYVAFTRARNMLFISGKGKSTVPLAPSQGSSIADWLGYACRENPRVAACVVEGALTYAGGEAPPEPELPCLPLTGLDAPYAHPGGTKLANKYAVSNFERVDRDDKTPAARYLGAQKAEIGTAYHKIMEKIDFQRCDASRVEELKAEYAALPGMDRVDAEVVTRMLAHPLFRRVARAPRLMREAPFLMLTPGTGVTGEETDEDVLVQGVVDLVACEEDGAVLIDYKVSGAPEEVLRARYAPQMDLYARALEQSGTPVKERYLVVLNRAEVLDMGGGDAHEAQ